MIQTIFICALAVSTVTAAPQFVTFKDGKIGVNFGGYTAEAGLGGLLTGNAAHGGLSASAGTPFGQRAAAGLDGIVNGDTAGRAYAGAQATDSIGASAVLGGSTGPNQYGIIGTEAHSNGNSVTKTITANTKNEGASVLDSSSELLVPTDRPKDSSVQKVKPPKKYTPSATVQNPIVIGQKTVEIVKEKTVPVLTEVPSSEVLVVPAVNVVKVHRHHGLRHYKHIGPAARRHFYKQVIYEPLPEQRFGDDDERTSLVKTTYRGVERTGGTTLVANPVPVNQDGYQTVEKNVHLAPGGLNQFFNIPIDILRSIRDNLQPLNVRKEVSYTRAV